MSSTIGISNATTVRDQRETQRRLGEHRSWEVMKNLDEEILGEESQHLDHLELSIYIPKWMRFLKPRPFIHQCIVKKQALPAWHQNSKGFVANPSLLQTEASSLTSTQMLWWNNRAKPLYWEIEGAPGDKSCVAFAMPTYEIVSQTSETRQQRLVVGSVSTGQNSIWDDLWKKRPFWWRFGPAQSLMSSSYVLDTNQGSRWRWQSNLVELQLHATRFWMHAQRAAFSQ